jgi:anthraniloyl-CoA monooxygenase
MRVFDRVVGGCIVGLMGHRSLLLVRLTVRIGRDRCIHYEPAKVEQGVREMRIAVVGGGPAGLLFGALLRERRPDVEVTLWERNTHDATYGFGVVFSASTLGRLERQDERLGRELREAATHWDRMELRLGGRAMSCGGLGFSAIARRHLLDLLQDRAIAAGVDVRFETESDVAAAEGEYDLVIGADGLNSAVRAKHEASMGSHLEVAAAKYIWFGASKAFDRMTFLFERTEAGWFAVHAYPYDDQVSTFVVECDPGTWRRAGFDDFDESSPPGVSDEKTRVAMQELFADALDGAELLANNSRWLSFRTLRVGRWYDGDAVVVGDAAHTAHFSVGSGTTMALEDASALATEVARVREPDGLGAALVAFEAQRRPSVQRVQDAATPSRSWWERFGFYAERFDLEQLCMHFFTRSGRVSARRLADGDAAFFERAAGGAIDEVTRRTLADGPLAARAAIAMIVPEDAEAFVPGPSVGIVLKEFGDRAWVYHREGNPTEAAVRWVTAPAVPDENSADAATDGLPAGALLVVDRAGDDLDARTAQVVLAENARIVHGATVVLVDADADEDTALTLVLTGRADAVAIGAEHARASGFAPAPSRELAR